MRCIQGHVFLIICFKEAWPGRRISRNGQWRSVATGVLVFVMLMLLTGCQLAQSSFSRTTSNAGAAFSSAALTLRYVHSGKITSAYARSAFMNYQSELQGLDQKLTSQNNAPDPRTVEQLLNLYKPAIHVINQPCLDASCNWRSQLNLLMQAEQAFLKAGEQ